MMKERNFQYTIFNAQFSVVKIPITIILLAGLFSGCSVSKQFSNFVHEMVLQDSALVNAHVGISVYDPATGKYLYDYQGDKYFVPASNTKLPTCYAAMKYLGDSLPGLRYIEVDDRIFIKGTGDPTFLLQEFEKQPVYKFLSTQRKKIQLDFSNWIEDMLGSGWAWNDYRQTYMAHRSVIPMYGNVLKVKLEGDKFQFIPSYFLKDLKIETSNYYSGFVATRGIYSNQIIIRKGTRKVDELTFHPDPLTINELLEDTLHQAINEFKVENTPVANMVIYSQPTDSVLKPMMHRSDNFFAEQILLMVSNEFLGYMHDPKIIDTILKTSLKDLPQPPRWVDGSGLSRYNLFSPRDFVTILNKMKNEFGMERLKVIMATGNEGTLEGRYKQDSGYIYAKTGTLSGVVALSGFVYTKSGKQLIFSFIVNNHTGSATAVRDAMEKLIRRIRETYK
jgi:serine-type D-Ala-D-Ala carboxypeptidase/endopeptidase (penicillin-binding protein 4)